MGGGDLNLKKSWAVNIMANQRRTYDAEQKALAERKRAAEVLKEREEERAVEELRRLQMEATGKTSLIDPKVQWMYQDSKGGLESEASEAYLLGKRRVDQIILKQDSAKEETTKNADPLAGALTARDIGAKAALDPLLAIEKQRTANLQSLMADPIARRRLMKDMAKKDKDDEKKERRKLRHRDDSREWDHHRSKRRRFSDESDDDRRERRRHRDNSRDRHESRRHRDRSRDDEKRRYRDDSEDRHKSRRRDRDSKYDDRRDRKRHDEDDRRDSGRSRSESSERREKRRYRDRSEDSKDRRSSHKDDRRRARSRSRSPYRPRNPDRPSRDSGSLKPKSADRNSDKEAEDRAAKLAAMSANANDLEDSRNRRLAEMEARDAAEKQKEDHRRDKRGDRFVDGLREQAETKGLGDRLKRVGGSSSRLEAV